MPRHEGEIKDANYDPEYWVTMKGYEQTVNGILAKLQPVNAPEPHVDGVYRMMEGRMMEMVMSLKVLEVRGVHDHYRDSATICRAMYDLHLQFLYILTDPPTLAEQYANFAYVENLNVIAVVQKYRSTIGPRMQARPEWNRVKAELERNANRFMHVWQYADGHAKKRWRTNWYVVNLDTVAERAGYKDEYHIMQKLLSVIVHSSSLTLLHDMVPGHAHLLHRWLMMLRVLGGIAAKLNVPLTVVEEQSIDLAKRSFF